MPRLNLKDDELEGGSESAGSGNEPTLPPNLREIGSGGGKSSPILIGLLVLLIILVAVFALNFFHVIHLWGRKPPQVVEMLPEPPAASSDSLAGRTSTGEPGSTSATPELTPTPSVTPGSTKETAASTTPERPRVTPPPLGSGEFSVQVSSWSSAAKAKEEADRLAASGYSAFVEESTGGKGKLHRVRIGKFTTMKEAREAASRYSQELETDAVVVKTGQE